MKRIHFICLFLCLTTLPAARLLRAQTETVLYNFCSQPNCTDGAFPGSSLTFDDAGNLYGTTYGGGLGYGTVFELSPNGSGGWNETVLYSFCAVSNCADGATPLNSYLIFDNAGNLYGTTFGGGNGGVYGYGVIFKLSPGESAWTETVLYTMCPEGWPCGVTGMLPVNGLIWDRMGNLYGIGENGMFELSPSNGYWSAQLIYDGYGDDTSFSTAGLTIDGARNIFGIGAAYPGLAVFELSPNGGGGWNSKVIQSFANQYSDTRATLVIDKAGNLFGTKRLYNHINGVVFELIPGKKGKWKEKTLHSFSNSAPIGGVVLDSAGNIYGTTWRGGIYNVATAYELLAPTGKGSYTEELLWSFDGTDGSGSLGSPVLDSLGNLYGTTEQGGPQGYGVVFEVTR